MKISKITILFLLSIIVISIFVANFSNLIAIKYDTTDKYQNNYLPDIILDNKTQHLMWFIQISDLHLSIFHDPRRIVDFQEFCNKTLNIIRPTVVLASGDLADSKNIDNMGSSQFIEEWKHYQRILTEEKVENKTIWLDIRGNHDNFNVPSMYSEKSYFHKYSVQGTKHLRSYLYSVKKGIDTYSFIAVDSCLEPGPRRPFNFIGAINDEQFEFLKKLEKESLASNKTIWFGHYPTSCIINPGLRDLMKSGVAYLCGHLHTLGGLIPSMYTLQHKGYLELELGDWKENRMFRVAAFDHGMFSFNDVYHKLWPIILITNPKHALFVLPNKEPLELIQKSTHVRLLIFSPTPLETVRFKINEEDWVDCQNIKGPLFVGKWTPNLYQNGIHKIQVYARNVIGEFSEITQPFSLDGSHLSFNFLPRVVLMTNATEIFFGAFIFLVLVSTLPLLYLRVFHFLVKEKYINKPDLNRLLFKSLTQKLWILSTINKLFYPLLLFPLYLLIGPWFIGEVIDGHMGVSFAWGTFCMGKFLPGSFTYFYGVLQLFWFHIPYVFIISHCVESRYKEVCMDCKFSYQTLLFKHVPCGILLLIQSLFAYYFWQAYGTIATILGPLRTWSVLMGIYLWYSTIRLKQNDFYEAKFFWGKDISNNSKQNSKHEL